MNTRKILALVISLAMIFSCMLLLSNGAFVRNSNETACHSIVYKRNEYIGRSGKSNESYFGTAYPFTYNTNGAKNAITSILGDTDAVIEFYAE